MVCVIAPMVIVPMTVASLLSSFRLRLSSDVRFFRFCSIYSFFRRFSCLRDSLFMLGRVELVFFVVLVRHGDVPQ